MTEAPSIKEALELCPFCGGKAELLNGGPGNWFVRCTNCKCTTNDVQRDAAIQLWHRRAALATLQPSGERREAIARHNQELALGFCKASFQKRFNLSDRRTEEYASCIVDLLNMATDFASGLEQQQSSTPVIPREVIAKILEPQAWAALGIGDTLAYKNRRTSSLRKADRILASGLVQDEAGIRANEREKCAKALDDIETDSDGKCHWTDVALATAAIRSARDGGTES